MKINTKWKWLAVNIVGYSKFYTQRPEPLDDQNMLWCLSPEAYANGAAEQEIINRDLIDTPGMPGLYERNGDDWVKE